LDDKRPLKGAWSGSHDPFSISTTAIISPEWLTRESPNFVCQSNISSLILGSPNGRGHGHVTRFYILAPLISL